MADKAIGTEDTLAAHAQGTTRGSDTSVPPPTGPSLRPGVTRASSPTLSRGPSDHEAGDYEELQEVDPKHYTIVAEIARGGMGRILEVRDRRLGRSVAIKEVLHGDETTLARFEREVRITARLQHPAIVNVHEAGVWPNGKPFYVMKLIRGKPLDVRIGKATTLAQRLEILPAVTTVVDALAYAHSQRVIHRDLKPANVLVGDFGETLVIDWGIAKELGDQGEAVSIPIETPEPTEAATETIAGSVIGTPSYMPPEQAAGERVDARADVYSLGAMLYQLLAGVPPFVGRTTAEVLAKVIDSDPEPLAKIDPDIPADLIAIVDKAMSKEPRDRFPTANEMAIELKRFQQGKLVESHRYTRSELVRRWLRRYRLPVTVAGIMLAALLVVGVWSVAKVLAARDDANKEAREARNNADQGRLVIAERALHRDPTETLAILKGLGPQSPQWDDARSLAADAASRGVADVLVDHGDAILGLTFSPSGRLLAEHTSAGTIRVWDLRTNLARVYLPYTELFDFKFASEDELVTVEFSGTVWRYTIATGQRTAIRTLPGSVEDINTARLSPDATQVLVFSRYDKAGLVDLASGSQRELGAYDKGDWDTDGSHAVLVDRNLEGHVDRYTIADGTITRLADRVEGEVASNGRYTWIGSWSAKGAHGVLREPGRHITYEVPEHINRIRMLPDGSVVVTSDAMTLGSDGMAGTERGTLVSVDIKNLALASHGVRIYAPNGAEPITLLGHTLRVEGLAISRDGKIATGDHRGQIRLWRVPPINHLPGVPYAANRAFLTPDHRYLAISRSGPRFDLRDLVTGEVRKMTADYPADYPRDLGHGIHAIHVNGAVIPDEFDETSAEVVELLGPTRGGTRFATLDQLHQLILWDTATGRGKMIAHDIQAAAISPDGSRLASVSNDGLQLHDAAGGPPRLLTENLTNATALALGDGDVVIAASADEHRTILFAPGRKPHALYAPTLATTRAIAIAPDGTHAVGAADDGVIRKWNLTTDDHELWIGHAGSVIALTFSPDGSHVASSGADRSIRVWNLEDGAMTICTDPHLDLAPTLRYENAHTIISASMDRTARICDPETGHSRALTGARVEVVFAAHITPSRVLTVDRFGGIAEHPDNLPYGELLLRAWLDSTTNVVP